MTQAAGTFLASVLALLSVSALQFDKGITINDADYSWGDTPNTSTFNFTNNELEEALATGELTTEHMIYMQEQAIGWNIDIEHHTYGIRRK